MFNSKKKNEVNNPMVLQPNFQSDEMEINQDNPIYNPQQPYQTQSRDINQQPVRQGIVQQMQQVQQTQVQGKSVIFKLEYTDKGTIIFTGEANYLIQLGDCNITQ